MGPDRSLRQMSAAVTFATAHVARPGDADGGDGLDWKHLAGAPTLVLFMVGLAMLPGPTHVKLVPADRSRIVALIESDE